MKEKYLQLFKNQTPEMFFVLGLIYGDGCVHFNEHTRKYYVNLTSEDIDLLETFRLYLGTTAPIKQVSKSKAYKINVWSKPLCETLFELFSLRNEKSHKLVYPNVPSELEKFFVAGLHAADGSNPILTIKKKYKDTIYTNYTLEWNYTSCSYDFIKKINEIVARHMALSPSKIHTRNHERGNQSYSIRYFGKKASKICQWMYDCSPHLRCNRKYLTWKKFISGENKSLKQTLIEICHST